MQVCEECGNINIQKKIWVNRNTLKPISGQDDDDTSDMWCEDCEAHTNQITQEEFNERNEN